MASHVISTVVLEKQAEEKKLLGNAAMAAKAYDEAIGRYSEALSSAQRAPTLTSTTPTVLRRTAS